MPAVKELSCASYSTASPSTVLQPNQLSTETNILDYKKSSKQLDQYYLLLYNKGVKKTIAYNLNGLKYLKSWR